MFVKLKVFFFYREGVAGEWEGVKLPCSENRTINERQTDHNIFVGLNSDESKFKRNFKDATLAYLKGCYLKKMQLPELFYFSWYTCIEKMRLPACIFQGISKSSSNYLTYLVVLYPISSFNKKKKTVVLSWTHKLFLQERPERLRLCQLYNQVMHHVKRADLLNTNTNCSTHKTIELKVKIIIFVLLIRGFYIVHEFVNINFN